MRWSGDPQTSPTLDDTTHLKYFMIQLESDASSWEAELSHSTFPSLLFEVILSLINNSVLDVFYYVHKIWS